MWIVRLALRRPYTFVVLAILILIMGALAIVRTPTDIFPNINIPVVSIIWSYDGLVPEDMSRPHRQHYGAIAYHDGRQYRAHRIAVAVWSRRRQSVPAAERKY